MPKSTLETGAAALQPGAGSHPDQPPLRLGHSPPAVRRAGRMALRDPPLRQPRREAGCNRLQAERGREASQRPPAKPVAWRS